MLKPLKLFLTTVLVVILQVSFLPACLEDPFRPNLMIIMICSIALHGSSTFMGAVYSYFAGLLIGSFSGFHFGLSGISYLLIFLLLNRLSAQLYTESIPLITTAVFAACLLDAFVTVVMTLLFTPEPAVYLSILKNLIPQTLITSLVTYLLFTTLMLLRRRFAS